METGKFFKIVNDLTTKINGTGLQAHFQAIVQNAQKLGQQAQTPVQNRQQFLTAIENARKEIKNAINTFIPPSLSVEDSKIYEALGAYELFGLDGQQKFDRFFADLQTNPNNIRPAIQQYQQDIAKITQLHSSFSPFSDKFPTTEHLDKHDLIILFFQSGAEVNNLDELAKVSAKWNQVLISFAILTKENDRTFRIETVERGSIILTLSAIAGIVYAFGKASDKVLDTVKKYYEIKKLAHEAKQLAGVPEKAIHELENSSKLKVKTETTEITKQLIEEYGWNEVEQRKDVDTAVRMAVRHLLEFVNKGGKVDIKLLAQNNDNKEMEMNLTLKYNEIKQIENKVSPIDGQKQMLELTEGEADEDEPNEKPE